MNIKVKTALRAILIGATVLPLIVIAIVATLNIFSFSTSTMSEEAATIGAARSSGIINIVEGYLSDAKAFAAMGSAKTALSDLNSVKSDLSDTADALSASSGGKVLGITITDTNGMIVYDSRGASAGTTFFAYTEGWSSKKNPFASKLLKDQSTNVFVAAAPFEGGFFAVTVNASAITDFLADSDFLTYGKLVVADSDTLINFSESGISSASELTGISPDLPTMISSKQSASGTAMQGGSYLGAYGSITGTDWVWLSLYPSDQANSSVMLVFIVGLVVIVALALVCVLVMIIATQKVINPMIDMLGTMKAINSGNHKERIDITGMGKEFGRISNVFNEMMDQAMMSEELHKTISDLSDNMLFEWDFAKESMFVSDNFITNIGLNVSGSTLSNGKFIDSLMDEENAEKYKHDMNQLFKSKTDIGGEYNLTNEKAQNMWVSMRAHCITDRLGEVLRVIGVLTDITSDKKEKLKLEDRASYDFLSQLYNRNTFEHKFKAELERSVGKKVAALFIDVDDFKFINDRYSHAVGDEVIKFVADTVKNRTGEDGFAGRFGGDEFVLCVSDPKEVENVEVLSMDIIDDLYSGYYSKSVDTTLNIKASIGIAIYPDHSTDPKNLVADADAAMYFVKKNGKANYHIYEPSDSELEGNFTSSL